MSVYLQREIQSERVHGATTVPRYELFVNVARVVWTGAWDGAYRIEEGFATKQTDVPGTITAIFVDKSIVRQKFENGLSILSKSFQL